MLEHLSSSKVLEIHQATGMGFSADNADERQCLEVLRAKLNQIADATNVTRQIRELRHQHPTYKEAVRELEIMHRGLTLFRDLVSDDHVDEIPRILKERFKSFLLRKTQGDPKRGADVYLDIEEGRDRHYNYLHLSTIADDLATLVERFEKEEETLSHLSALHNQRNVEARGRRKQKGEGGKGPRDRSTFSVDPAGGGEAVFVMIKMQSGDLRTFFLIGESNLLGGYLLRRLFQEQYGKLGFDTAEEDLANAEKGYPAFLRKLYGFWGLGHSTNPDTTSKAVSSFRSGLKQNSIVADEPDDAIASAPKNGNVIAWLRQKYEASLGESFDVEEWLDAILFDVDVFSGLINVDPLDKCVEFVALADVNSDLK